jgi:hypothetical protein
LIVHHISVDKNIEYDIYHNPPVMEKRSELTVFVGNHLIKPARYFKELEKSGCHKMRSTLFADGTLLDVRSISRSTIDLYQGNSGYR